MVRPKHEFPKPYLRKHPNGIFYVHWSEHRKPKKFSTGTGNEGAAERILNEFSIKLRTPEEDEKENCKIIIDEYLRYKKAEYTRKKMPLLNYRKLEGHMKGVKAFFGNYSFREIKRPLVDRYDEECRSKGIKDGTIRKRLAHFTAALNHAYKEEWIDRVPYIWKPDPGLPRDILATEEQTDLILQYASFHVRIFTLIGLHTSSRMGAILELTWDRVDFKSGLIDFNLASRTRTSKRRVAVPMNSVLREALLEARQVADSEYVVEYKGKGIQDIGQGFRRTTRRIKKVTRKDLTFITAHALRHIAIYRMVNRGVPWEEISAITGDSVETLREHYAKYSPEYLRGAVKALGKKNSDFGR